MSDIMRIEHYSWGKIVIEGRTYTFDLVIYPDRVMPSWWRKEGHKLHMDDLSDVLEAKPAAIIIGTGFYGAMSVPAEVTTTLRSKGIDVRVTETAEAVTLYNELSTHTKTIACLHLTC